MGKKIWVGKISHFGNLEDLEINLFNTEEEATAWVEETMNKDYEGFTWNDRGFCDEYSDAVGWVSQVEMGKYFRII